MATQTAYTSDAQGRARLSLTITPTSTGASWAAAVSDGNSSYGGWASASGSWSVTVAGQAVVPRVTGKSYDFGSGQISNPYFPRSENGSVTLSPGTYTASATFSGDGTTVGTASVSFQFTVTAPTPSTTYYYYFNPNGGSNSFTNPDSTTATSITAPDPGTRSGFTFSGWNGSIAIGDTIQTSSFSTSSSSPTTFLAYWTQNPSGGGGQTTTYYYYAFDSNGGSSSPASGSTTSGSTTMPSPGTRTGYTFLGWQIGGSGSDYAVNSSAPVSSTSSSSPTTFIAHWTLTDTGGGTTYPPTWSDINLGQFITGKTYNDSVSATNMSYSGSYSVSSGSLPSGVTLNSSNGVISGTVSSSSDYSFTITATNTYGSIQQSFSGAVTGGIRIWNGTAWTKQPAKIWNGTAWTVGTVNIWNGTSWTQS